MRHIEVKKEKISKHILRGKNKKNQIHIYFIFSTQNLIQKNGRRRSR
jgi:hypothetical protein